MSSTTVDADSALLRRLAEVLREAAGEGAGWAAAIRPDDRIEQDLWFDSVELAALDVLLRDRFGERVDLARHVAGLDIDRLVELRVADLLALVGGEQGEA